MSGRHVDIAHTVFRSIKLFGGVQVVSNLCSVALNKAVAVWIGPAGMGMFSIFNSAIDLLRTSTSLGLRNSCVRYMAMASESGDEAAEGRMVALIRKWAWFAAIFGAVTTMALAPALSRWSFGSSDHVWDFVLLAGVLMFNGLVSGEQAILQGSDRLRLLARSSLAGTVLGLVCSIPLFYFFRLDGIIYSVVVYHAALLLTTLLCRRRDIKTPRMSVRESVKEGSPFVKLGIMLALSDFVAMFFTYVFSAYLNRTAGTETVGFYQSGFSLVGRYVGLVFTAIGVEYYPRLSRVCGSRMRMRAFVSQEINILMLALLPIVAVFLVSAKLIVWLLYSSEFHVIVPYISLMIVGTVFRAYSWCMAVSILARGDGRVFLITEALSAATGFSFNVAGYHLWGLRGLGAAYVGWYAVYCLISGFVYFRRYGYALSRESNMMSLAVLAVSVIVYLLMAAGLFWWAVAAAVAACGGSLVGFFRLLRRHRGRNSGN